MTKNVGGVDRILRIVVGIALIAAAFTGARHRPAARSAPKRSDRKCGRWRSGGRGIKGGPFKHWQELAVAPCLI